MLGYQAEVAPVNLRDINIIQDGKLTREWKLWKHNDNLCYDEKEGAVARAVQPLWLIDNHIEWKTINKITTSSRVGIAFDARCALFYVVSPESVKVLDEDGRLKQETAVRGGYPAVEYPNHLLYDTLSNALVSYSLTENIISAFRSTTENGATKYGIPKRPTTITMPKHLIPPTPHSTFSADMASINTVMTCSA